ncbi:MAG: response regulator [Saprospiraceae bacterium]
MTDDKIKVIIVEDDLEFQSWILEEINDAPHIECIQTFDVAEDALAAIPQLKPDIVIMDLGLDKSDMDGIECMLRLKIVAPKLKFLVITSNSDEASLFEALRVGAGAYVQKGDIPKQLIDLLEDFHLGGAPMSPGIARRIIENFHKPAEDLVRLKTLSPRENETLELLSKGFLYKEIGNKLTIAEGTVKQHTHNIYKKLQVNNCIEAIRKYLNI